MKCLVAFVGPTAIGKSSAATAAALRYGAEIINADSRQIYQYMDIGTAKPSLSERREIPHYLLDIISPDESYSVALYQRSANKLITQIQKNSKFPILVGGSGQYIWSVLEGWQIPEVAPDINFRHDMEEECIKSGPGNLYLRLKDIDPASAAKILPGNVRRIIRALEIHRQTGMRPSMLHTKKAVDYPVLVIGLTAQRTMLYEKIDRRVDSMVRSGFIEEVQKLMEMGYSDSLPSMSSLGYGQITCYLRGKIGLDDAIQKIKYDTHRFARSQYAWFRLKDSRIRWVDVNDDIQDEINYTIQTFLDAVH